MPKVVTQKTVVVKLELTEKEATLLMGMVQNPLSDDEDTDTRNFRQALFECLQAQGIKP